ncbi:hypothetical protein [Streptomyces candidus]|uniref:hypothetical protein n=1 Tax=Streptomyces candidus TaxID=67283 RepID=UPI001C88DA54|nr:hypothetical protein [Streptomyces candidus]
MAVGAAALATVLGTVASPAHAVEAGEAGASRASNTDIFVKSSRGYMLFHDDGDVFEICDTNADGHGVEGQLVDYFTGTTYLYLDDGGDKGCDKKGYDIGANYYVMHFWWSGDGIVRKSGRFNE